MPFSGITIPCRLAGAQKRDDEQSFSWGQDEEDEVLSAKPFVSLTMEITFIYNSL